MTFVYIEDYPHLSWTISSRCNLSYIYSGFVKIELDVVKMTDQHTVLHNVPLYYFTIPLVKLVGDQGSENGTKSREL